MCLGGGFELRGIEAKPFHGALLQPERVAVARDEVARHVVVERIDLGELGV